MRGKKIIYSITTSFLLQCITIMSGFILPRLILVHYGSDVNGILSSITQFLGYITLFEAGIGGVARAALYKPLEEKDYDEISLVMKTTESFFKKIAVGFIIYTIILGCCFNIIIHSSFEWFYTFSLVLIISISTVAQYYFGVSNSILLQADMKNYITNIIQCLTILSNTIIAVILIKVGATIHIVKAVSAVIFVLRPLLMQSYVKRHYTIKKNVEKRGALLQQKWDGLWHHLAWVLHTNTDIAVLSLFASLKEVSVYSVYYMIVAGVEKLVQVVLSGTEAAFGNMIAKNEEKALIKNFEIVELTEAIVATILFTTAWIAMTPFVRLYTSGVNDINYIRPVTGFLLICSETIYCARLPYHSIVAAAGHYRQTRIWAFFEAFINVCLSLVLVNLFSMNGVVAATVIAMLFRTVQYAVYLQNHILSRKIKYFIKRQIVNILAMFTVYVVVSRLKITDIIVNYVDWVFMASKIAIIASVITLLYNCFFYRQSIDLLFRIVKKIFSRING